MYQESQIGNSMDIDYSRIQKYNQALRLSSKFGVDIANTQNAKRQVEWVDGRAFNHVRHISTRTCRQANNLVIVSKEVISFHDDSSKAKRV